MVELWIAQLVNAPNVGVTAILPLDIFDDQNADAQFIWSSNLILDNVVLLRKTID